MATATIKPGCEGQTACRRYPKLAELVRYLDSLTARANLDILGNLLGRVSITRQDILPVCLFGERSYKRNTIAESAYYELLALCWKSGHCTPIHDHRGSSCAFRVVEGTGTEVRYRLAAAGVACPVTSLEMPEGYICAAQDADIHQVANLQPPGKDLITLHIYSTPILKMNRYPGPESPGAET